MDRKPSRHNDGSSSRPAQRGSRGPRAEGDRPRRDGESRFRDRDQRGGDRFESRGPRPDRDGGDRPRRPARAEWQKNDNGPRSDQPRFERNDRDSRGAGRPDRFERSDRPGGKDRFERNDRPGFERNDRPGFERRDRFERNDRFDRNDRLRDRRPREEFNANIDDDAGNRVDYSPRPRSGGFEDRRPRGDFGAGRGDRRPEGRGGDDRGRADRGRDDRGPRGDREQRDRFERRRPEGAPGGTFTAAGARERNFDDNGRSERPRRDGAARGEGNPRNTEKPRKEKYQVWNKELPPLDESAKSERSTLKLAGKGDAIERKIYGVNACMSFFSQRPQDIIRAYFTESVARQHFGDLMKFLAQEKLAYHLVPSEDMERITESTHHEGVCLLVRDQAAESFFHWLETNPTESTQAQCILALENLGNPHNIGAIMRVAAHFGVKAVVVKDAGLARSGAAIRTAEGGADHVRLLEADDFERMLAACRREGYTVVSTSSHQGTNLFETALPARAVILFGQETKGLSPNLQDSSDLKVRIPGTQNVESLNVSVATGILLADYWRHHAR